jgi:hypothetical protein
MKTINWKNLVSGLTLAAIGTTFFIAAFGYEIGTARVMGPGYFPRLVSGLLILAGLAIAVLEIRRADGFGRPAWRQLAAVFSSLIVFALVMTGFGLIPSVFVTVCVASLASSDARFGEIVALAAAIALLAWLIFVVLLGLPFPAYRVPLS